MIGIQIIIGELGLYILMGQRVYKGSRGGACIPKRDFPKFYRIDKAGELNLEDAITERYELNNINEAIQRLKDNQILGRAIIEINKNAL